MRRVIVYVLIAVLLPAPASALTEKEAGKLHAEAHELASTGRYAEAAERYLELRKAVPENAALESDLGTVYYLAGDYETADGFYRRAVQLQPQESKFHTHLGSALQMREKFGKALAEYDKAVELDPQNFKAVFNRAALLDMMERTDEAIAGFEAALLLRDDAAHAHYYYAKALLKKDLPEEAWHHVRRSRALGYEGIERGFLNELEKRSPEPAPAPLPQPKGPPLTEEDLKSYMKKNPPPERS